MSRSPCPLSSDARCRLAKKFPKLCVSCDVYNKHLENRIRTLEEEKEKIAQEAVHWAGRAAKLESDRAATLREVEGVAADYAPGGKFQAVKWVHNHTLVQRLRAIVERGGKDESQGSQKGTGQTR